VGGDAGIALHIEGRMRLEAQNMERRNRNIRINGGVMYHNNWMTGRRIPTASVLRKDNWIKRLLRYLGGPCPGCRQRELLLGETSLHLHTAYGDIATLKAEVEKK